MRPLRTRPRRARSWARWTSTRSSSRPRETTARPVPATEASRAPVGPRPRSRSARATRARTATRALAVSSLQRGGHAVVSIGLPDTARNGNSAQIAPFSSHGLAFDGRVKPDVAAPGVVLATAEAGRNEDGTPRFGTVNGSSAAAAVVTGAAALLAQLRTDLSASDLKSLLAGTASALPDTTVTAEGGGLV